MNLGGTIRVNKIGFCIICCIIILFVIYLSPPRTSQSKPIVNIKTLLLAAIEAAERGGEEVVRALNDTIVKHSKGETKEGVNIPVTNADYKSHCVMYYGIREIFPNIKVISEEEEEKRNCVNLLPLDIDTSSTKLPDLPDEKVDSSKLTVWIDPLDATKEYTEKLFNFVTTMVCIAYEGRPIIGVIHKPFEKVKKTHWAWVNKGSSFVNKQIKEHNGPNIVIISRSHAGYASEKVKKFFGTNTRLFEAGGSGYKSLEVAVENVTAYFHTTDISKWDICAGDAIITALGGRFTDLNGNEIDYSSRADTLLKTGVLAAPLKKHVEVLKRKQGSLD
ncbi:putative inositol monophosphatase 3 [Cimex lectularius]|uniref:inositol-phosphate phosphatase n=1 Tax=Cimex lectularius TaxID=79782 RepID=A0A8I6RDV6_CIMLE|nr:putative inositol monophosphatase 3 [Cimex lectularius]